MNRRRVAALLASVAFLLFASPARTAEPDPGIPPNMAVYYFGILVRGSKWSPEDTPERAKIQEGHMAHIRAMAQAGTLLLAGPFMDDGDWRGILIYKASSLEEAQKLADDDPAVKAGRLAVTMHALLLQKGALTEPAAKR